MYKRCLLVRTMLRKQGDLYAKSLMEESSGLKEMHIFAQPKKSEEQHGEEYAQSWLA